jgi:hypothetical protein
VPLNPQGLKQVVLSGRGIQAQKNLRTTWTTRPSRHCEILGTGNGKFDDPPGEERAARYDHAGKDLHSIGLGSFLALVLTKIVLVLVLTDSRFGIDGWKKDERSFARAAGKRTRTRTSTRKGTRKRYDAVQRPSPRDTVTSRESRRGSRRVVSKATRIARRRYLRTPELERSPVR